MSLKRKLMDYDIGFTLAKSIQNICMHLILTTLITFRLILLPVTLKLMFV